MLDRYDYIRDPITNDAFVNHTWQVEFVFEMVRRVAFPRMNSRFQSYFAWETLDAARSFRKETQTIYRIQAEKGFRARPELVDTRNAGCRDLIVRSPILVGSRVVGIAMGNCCASARSHS